MQEIRLTSSNWFFDSSTLLGRPGGFGSVFPGISTNHEEVAVKQLNIGSSGFAHREIRVAEFLVGRSFNHIIPVLDFGEDAESGRYYIVMARAEKSLEQEIDSSGPFTGEEILQVLQQIASGLLEANGLVHRDLKPGNVLWHEGSWKLADFGIAKFVEEATSLRTLNDFLSSPYAAPEQWRSQRVSVATDLYALGCVAYELTTGNTPFQGPIEELRELHLHGEPPLLPESVNPRLQTLIAMLLRKSPESRPSLGRVREILASVGTLSIAGSHSPVAAAAARIERRRALAEATRLELAARKEKRHELAEFGNANLIKIMASLQKAIINEAQICEMEKQGILSMELGRIRIVTEEGDFAFLSEDTFPKSGWDIVSVATVGVHQRTPQRSWTASLIYAAEPNCRSYRWYEVSFWDKVPPRQTPQDIFQRYWLESNYSHIDAALAHESEEHAVAFGPVPIDDEGSSLFFERWMTLFALAAEGELPRPEGDQLEANFWTTLIQVD